VVKVSVVPEVEITREGPVLTITLNRPDVLNALNRAVHDGIYDGLRQAAADLSIRAVVITGAGRGFCVGQDLQEFRSGAGDIAETLRRTYHRNVLAIRALEKPVIAAVNGPAAGAGVSLALACDVRIAADEATFVPAFINIGLVPDSGGTWFVRRLLGTGRAFEWLTTGRRLSAEEARDWGIVSEVVPAEELAARAQEVAELFGAMPTRAVWETKRLLDAAETSTLPEQLELEARTQVAMTGSPDFVEGTSAFLEKRSPTFTGTPRERAHPVSLVVHDDLSRWRLTVALRWLLVIPHALLVLAWGAIAFFVAIVNWVITLVKGRSPARLHAWNERYVRYWVHVNAYQYLVADPFPKFRGWFGTYPIDLEVAPPAPQSRWKTALRVIIAIPAYIFAYVLSIVLQVVAFIGWFVAIAVGRFPRGFRDLGAYALRFNAQTYAFLLFLTDRWPSIAAEGSAGPATPASSSAAARRTSDQEQTPDA
jgi:2-(1,2-epoxy-1,2-dihydrophenyl)acetyl-CoA isomerase